jgi:sigma-B regulation protein RsbU (phosphoserine phosphatase)
MDYCNAAHNYPYILHANGTITSLSKSHGLPLGIYKDKLYKSSSAQLRYGDLILLYTDGVINSTDSHNHHYGSDKLEKNIQNLSDMSSEEVVNRLVKSIVIYEGGSRQSDDITLVALRYLQQET